MGQLSLPHPPLKKISQIKYRFAVLVNNTVDLDGSFNKSDWSVMLTGPTLCDGNYRRTKDPRCPKTAY
jgi:hypothetical protein